MFNNIFRFAKKEKHIQSLVFKFINALIILNFKFQRDFFEMFFAITNFVIVPIVKLDVNNLKDK